jgi:hypothetical protein
MTKITLNAQIGEVDRELRLRNDVYEIAISKGKMRRAVADLHLAHMRAVRATLVWLQENEALIKHRLGNDATDRETSHDPAASDAPGHS